MGIRHAFTSTVPDGTDATVVRPSNWNADHDISALAFSDLPSGLIQELLSADRTYYVRSDGNDSNSGLTNTAGGAKLTYAAALTAARQVNANGHDITIHLQDGTWTAQFLVDRMPIGIGNLILEGNTATPGNVIISTTSQDAVKVQGGAALLIKGIEVRTTSSGYGINAEQRSRITLDHTSNRFGVCADGQVVANLASLVYVNAGYTITGNTPIHFRAVGNSLIYVAGSLTVDATNRAFSNIFATAQDNSEIVSLASYITSGSTGTRYYCDYGGFIQTFGSGASYFPGDAAGFASAANFSAYF